MNSFTRSPFTTRTGRSYAVTVVTARAFAEPPGRFCDGGHPFGGDVAAPPEWRLRRPGDDAADPVAGDADASRPRLDPT
jgi:hypothetical protein